MRAAQSAHSARAPFQVGSYLFLSLYIYKSLSLARAYLVVVGRADGAAAAHAERREQRLVAPRQDVVLAAGECDAVRKDVHVEIRVLDAAEGGHAGARGVHLGEQMVRANVDERLDRDVVVVQRQRRRDRRDGSEHVDNRVETRRLEVRHWLRAELRGLKQREYLGGKIRRG